MKQLNLAEKVVLLFVIMLITGRTAHSAALPILFLLKGRFFGFSSRRGDMLH